MPLLVANLTGSPVTLAAGNVVVPASASAPTPGVYLNVTSELRPNLTVDPINGITGGLSGANYTSIQAQTSSVVFIWTGGTAEYLTTGLTITSGSAAHTSITATGNISFSKETNHTVSVAASTTGTTVGGNLTIASGNGNGAAGGNLVFDTGTGSAGGNITVGGTAAAIVNVGRAAGSVGFFGAAAVTKPTAYTQTYATADKTHANPTAATLTMADGAGTNDNTLGAITADASVIAAFQEVVDEINKAIADVADLKQLVNSVIDDLQALGLAG